MTERSRFCCALIGTGSVLTQSGDELRSRGHEVIAVATPDAKVRAWARAHDIPCFADAASMQRDAASPDYLFSIVNNDVLTPEFLAWPSRLPVNYHDGPLPRYAGIHATSWALMAGETSHAVSWHVMTDRVDFGDILAQSPFAIADDDTAFTLNARAYEAALASFRTLIDALETGSEQRVAQSASARSFFGRHKRPRRAGVADWRESAVEMHRLARAMDFGPYDNPFCGMRIWTGDRFLFAGSASLTDTGPNATPGTILSSGADWLRVSTADHSDIRFTDVREIDGGRTALSDDARFACARMLPALPSADLETIVAMDAAAHRHESWWIDRLSSLQPVMTPFIGAITSSAGDAAFTDRRVDAPALSVTQQIAAFALFLARVGRNCRFDLPLHGVSQPTCDSTAGALFETHPPMRVDMDATRSFIDIRADVEAELSRHSDHPTYARDIAIRSMRLRDIQELRSTHVWHASIEIGEDAGARGAITLKPAASGSVLRFRDDILSDEAQDSIAAQFACLLASIAADESLPGDALPMLPDSERHRVLERFAGPVRPYERGVTLPDLIARQVESRPNDVAVVFEGASVTYAELDAISNRIARRLQDGGVRPGVLVGVCLERSIELVAALVGVVKSGGAYVPLDPTYPIERLTNMAEDADVSFILTRGTELAALGGWNRGEAILLDEDSMRSVSTDATACPATESDPAYAIFTSGSTGRPKGAANAHRGIINRLMWMQEHYELAPGDRVLQKTPYSFDVSVWEFFWPLITGATIVVAKPEGHRDAGYLAELIRDSGVTVLHFVPSMLRVFVEEREVTTCESIRRVVCSGEALPYDLVQRFFDRLPHAKLANLYGPTEAAVDVTAWECQPDDPRGIIPIGAAVANTNMYVLDDRLTPTAVGVPGELYIGGVQVGLGYVNRPELTAERFVADPFVEGGRMYRTGDLGRWLPDGTIEYLGRIDDQVKIRGFRIELGEIEHVLSQQPHVREAVVLAREDVPGVKRLVAYIVGLASPSDLREAAARVLPEYMVPTAFVTLAELPVTANGKLDRRALPAPPRGSGAESSRPFVAPEGAVEERLASIWAQMLQIERVSVEDNFFEIGGDSILALRIVALAQDSGVDIAVHDLFRAPTIRALAAAGASGEKSVTKARTQPFELIGDADRALLPDGVVDAYPLSALQSGMVFHSERSIGSYLYQVAMSLHVRAELDMEILQRAVNRVVSRHPILRTSFDLGGYSEPMQLVHGEAMTEIEYHDIAHLSTDAQNELLAKWIDDEAEYEFDWSDPPLLKYTVHRRGPGTFQFGITFHDAILDGWSTSNMVTEIFERYVTMLGGGEDAEDAPNPITYRDFVSLERSTLKSEAARKFWTELMTDAPFTAAPRLPGVGADVPVARNLDVIVPIPSEVNRAVETRARELGLPVKAFYLAVHTRIMGLIAAQDEVVTGLVMNGRVEDPGGDRSLGNHLNTMPYRLHVGGQTWIELARGAHAAELAALPHRRYIGAQLLRDLGRAGQDNLFETGFNYTHFHVYDRLADRDDIEFLRVDFTDPFHYVLVANFRVDAYDKRLDVVLNYNTKHMTAAQVKQVGAYYIAAMRTIARDPGAAADAACMLPKSERAKVLETFNGPARAYESDVTLGGLFDRQARETPGAIALRFEDQSVSYAELDRISNRIANRIAAAGAGPGSLVGVCLERSVELVAALLGVVRAGAAYVPLDPTYPADRLAGMAEDAELDLVVSRGRELEMIGGWDRGEVIRVDDPSFDSWSADPVGSGVSDADPAYVIFTSGSTGRPKGAMNAHRGVVNRLMWMQEHYELTASDRVLQKTPYSFDVSVWEFFWPLITGATLVVARPDGHRDGGYLADLIAREGVTVLHFVPSMLRAFVEEPTLDRCVSLRRVVCSGEALPPDLVDRFLSRMPQVRLANLYGPTEAAIDVTAWECVFRDPSGIVPIGRPVPNTRIRILDADMNPTPVGVSGELFIGGVQVGMGYINRPELTEERFIDDPFASGERLYRTGDVARWLPDGSIEYLGRSDDQVKIRGFRIELGEIETALSAQPGVREAAVIAREDVPGSLRLVAYVVGDASQNDLRRGLARTLPEYMVPSAFVSMDALPLSANGKLDRRALPAPGRGDAGASARSDAAPMDDLQSALASIWAEVLRLPDVGVHDNFFEIGGDSILSIQICARARRSGVLITPDQIFDHPTIAELAPHAREAGATQAEQGPATGEVALIPIQKWLLDQPLARPDHWNAAIMLEAPARIDDITFRTALHAIVTHHDALRLRYTRDGDGWTQRYGNVDGHGMHFDTVLVDDFDGPDAAASIERHGAELQAHFDLANGPVFGGALFRERRGDRARLLLVAHHLVLDGYSWRVIIEDVMTACDQIGRGEEVILPAKTHSLKTWTEALKSHAAGVSESPDERSWWLREGQSPAEIRVDHDDAADLESDATVMTTVIDEARTKALLQDVCGAYRAQMNDVLLGAFGMALRGWRPEASLRIDMMGHGREAIGEDLDVARTVGWFTSLFPVTIPLTSMADPRAAISAIREYLRRIPGRGLGYGLLRTYDASDVGDAIRGHTPATVSFNYLGQFDQSLPDGWSLRIARTRCGPPRDPQSPRSYRLEVDAMIVGDRLHVDWTYGRMMFEEETIRRLSDGFMAAVTRIIENVGPGADAGPSADAFDLAGLSDDGLARLSALFDSGDVTDE